MKTNLIKTELTLAQILNHQLNWGYRPNAKDLDNLCPIIHLSKLEIDQEDNQPLDQYQLGMLEYITPHIAYLATIAPYVQLISIETKERDYEGIHIWTFALKTPNLMDYEPSMIDLMNYEPSLIDTLTDTFKECFPYDSQACFNHSPQIKYLNGLFTIIVPFTC